MLNTATANQFPITTGVGVTTNGTCICVPTGRCTGSGSNFPTDGSGQFDIRIVNSVGI